MKLLKITAITGLGILALATVHLSCTKSYLDKIATANDDLSRKTQVQVFNATVNSKPSLVYVDGLPVNGYSTPLTYGNVFPGTAFSFSVEGGLRAFLIKDSSSATSVQPPLNFAENMDMGKNYTVFMYDTMPAVKQLTIRNDLVVPSDDMARVKFVNFIYNNAAVPAVDVFSVKKNANVFTNIQKTEGTAYIPYTSLVNDTLLVRETGTMNQVAALNGFSPTPKRSYTLIYRGSYKGTKAISAFSNN